MPLAVIGTAVVAPTMAAAQEYPAPPTQVTVSDEVIAPGGAVVFSATGGFIPGEEILIEISYGNAGAAARGADKSDLGRIVPAALPDRRAQTTVTANANGGFSVELTLTRAGTATLTATGLQSGVTVSRTVTVSTAAADVEGEVEGPLPVTGDSGPRLALQVGGAAVAVFLGGMLLWLGADRRRRNRAKA